MNIPIENPGWISSDKPQNIMRLYYTNPHRLGFDSTEKLIQLEKESKKLKIDGYLFSSTDRKWNSVNERKIKSTLSKIHQRIEIETSDTSDY